jgi:uncharacterized protein (DUF885 family)
MSKRIVRRWRGASWLATAGAAALWSCSWSSPAAREPQNAAENVAVSLVEARSELREFAERYSADRGVLQRRYDLASSPERRARLAAFFAQTEAALAALDHDALGLDGRIDYALLHGRIAHEKRELARREQRAVELAEFAPFAGIVFDLHAARRERATPDAVAAATRLEELVSGVKSAREELERKLASKSEADAAARPSPSTALRAVELVRELRGALERWFEFYDGYDPLVSWWCAKPKERATKALDEYAKLLRERVVGAKNGEDEPIVGDPIGRETLLAHLQHERIPYTPEELVAIAEREFAVCDERMLAASRKLGCGDDWKAALEKVKALHVAPGEQVELVRELAFEAIEFLEKRGLLTIPELAKEVWRVEMMSPERQKVNPFFLGGESVIVSFPTDTMDHEDKLMSLRANNRHFSRAVVHHELIPGHHLQQFMTQRHQPHRREFSTPFWTEGWALYWEMLLWDQGFARGPEDEIGMLFWRMHRCARIVFSLRFHLGEMTPQECIDYLVERVGHERFSAEGEVRRSFNGDYSPLYQVAYMLGGLQFRALRRELVEGGRMSDREFHDAVLTSGNMPVELVRARLTGAKLERGQPPAWRFAD